MTVVATYSAATVTLCVVVVLYHCIVRASASMSSNISFQVLALRRCVWRFVSSSVVMKYVAGSSFHHPGVPSAWRVLPSVSWSVLRVFVAVRWEQLVSVCLRCDCVSSKLSVFAQRGHLGLYSACASVGVSFFCVGGCVGSFFTR